MKNDSDKNIHQTFNRSASIAALCAAIGLGVFIALIPHIFGGHIALNHAVNHRTTVEHIQEDVIKPSEEHIKPNGKVTKGHFVPATKSTETAAAEDNQTTKSSFSDVELNLLIKTLASEVSRQSAGTIIFTDNGDYTYTISGNGINKTLTKDDIRSLAEEYKTGKMSAEDIMKQFSE